jgi:xanthine dehydrogenase YagS FAD-binding subunit
MQVFEYATPTTKEQAVQALGASWGETEVLAGGTDLVSLMKEYLSSPKRVVDIKGIRELQGIGPKASGLRIGPLVGLHIGALVTLQELADATEVREQYPALVQAAMGVTSPQIRARGTVGGELCQRPRCWYYRAGFGLLAEHDGKPLVPEGENRYHAIFGVGPAYFVNPSSLAPALIALRARLRLFGPRGAREVALADFFVIPNSSNERENVLKPNEIVAEILVPPSGGFNATYEVRQRTALDWPLVAAAVELDLRGKTVRDVRVVLGHVAPIPWRSPEAGEALLKGIQISEETAMAAGQAAVRKAQPLSGNGYKVQLARTAVKRAVLLAAQGA